MNNKRKPHPSGNRRKRAKHLKDYENNNCDEFWSLELNCNFVKGEKHRAKNCSEVYKCRNNVKCVKQHRSHKILVKTKQRREPLPMKLRAFPQSFWQQPNKTSYVSPANEYRLSPPFTKEENTTGSITHKEEAQDTDDKITTPNIDLLFSLFRSVDQKQNKATGQEKPFIVRRGRPKKLKTETKALRDDDPYLTSSAAESMLPFLPGRNHSKNLQSKKLKNEQVLSMISSDEIATTDQNYSEILSELLRKTEVEGAKPIIPDVQIKVNTLLKKHLLYNGLL